MAGRLRLGIAAALVVVSAAACGDFGAPDPASEQADAIHGLWRGTVIAALAVGALVWGLIAWSIIRYRRRSDTVPNQRAHNVPLEILYTVVPVLIVGTLFFFTMRTQDEVTDLVEDPDVTVEVVGFQWQWQFRYLEDDGSRGPTITGASVGAPPELVLPIGRTTRLKLVTEDVIHSFWVPRFLSKRDLIPNVRNEIDVTPTEAGSFVGRCAEFCGLDHWRMNFSVRVVGQGEFDRWLAEQEEQGP
jgi:cytochrome c oxidase subunit 2